LVFDPQTGLASEYTPLKDDGAKIVINPLIKFGAPIVKPCGYTVATLIDAYESEGSIEAAADAYEVTRSEVKLALSYDDVLAGIAGMAA
jgi:uncharacterized protein (DUF433 family)